MNVPAGTDEAGARPGLKISELAEAAAVPVATVRHYLREGLLPEGLKTSRNMAYYPPELVERIRLIKLLQEERFMPLRVIGELLGQEGGVERLRADLDAADRGLEAALARQRERLPASEVSAQFDVPEDALDRLAEIGVLSGAEDGYSPADVRIVEAISRFRAAGYDERIGFTVHDAARFLEPLNALVRRQVELLSERVVGRFDADRAAELIEAGIDPLAELIAAMNEKLLAQALEKRDPSPPS